MFIEYNANPNGDNIDDCAIRAITKVMGLDYYEVFDELCELMDETPCANDINQSTVVKKFFDNHNCEIIQVTDKLTVNQFCKTIKECRDIDEFNAMLIVNGHITACIAGDIYDTWNPSRYKVQFVVMPCEQSIVH